MDVRQVVAGILEGSDGYRIDKVTQLLENGGVRTGDDLKYFDWRSLEELGGLSKMEINKIMRYVQEKFPFDYEEHKKKKSEERKLQNDIEIHKFKVEHERKLLQEKMKFENEKEERLKKHREMEEEYKCFQKKNDIRNSNASTLQEKGKQAFEYFKNKVLNNYEKEEKDHVESEVTEKCFIDKDMTIEQAIYIIFDGNIQIIEPITNFLKSQLVTKAENLRNLNWELLKSYGQLTDHELDKIKKFAEKKFPKDYERQNERRNQEPKYNNGGLQTLQPLKMSIEEAIANTFHKSETSKITSALKNNDINMAVELKYFDRESLQDMDLDDTEINKIMEFVKRYFPKIDAKHKKRKFEETKAQEGPSKCDAIKKQEEPKTEVKTPIDKMISEILEGFAAPRIEFVANALKNSGLKTFEELAQFDEKSMRGIGLLEVEVRKIKDYLNEKVPKNDEKHKENKDKIEMKDFKSMENSSTKHLMEDAKSSLKVDDANLFDEFKKFDWDSLNDIIEKLLKLSKQMKQNNGMKGDTQECLIPQVLDQNDKSENSGSNIVTSNDQSQKSEDTHAEDIDANEEHKNSIIDKNQIKDESHKEDGFHQFLMHSSPV